VCSSDLGEKKVEIIHASRTCMTDKTICMSI
jgi:hypothetical protein